MIRYRANVKAMKLKYVFPGFVFIPGAYINTPPFFAEYVDFHVRQTLLLFAIFWRQSSYISHERPINVLGKIVFYVLLLLLQRFSVSGNLLYFPPTKFSLDEIHPEAPCLIKVTWPEQLEMNVTSVNPIEFGAILHPGFYEEVFIGEWFKSTHPGHQFKIILWIFHFCFLFTLNYNSLILPTVFV